MTGKSNILRATDNDDLRPDDPPTKEEGFNSGDLLNGGYFSGIQFGKH